MKVLVVSGTREELTQDQFTLIEDKLVASRPDLVIHGACGASGTYDQSRDELHGVDAVADCYAVTRATECVVIRMPAQWRKHGDAAGPMRNTEMVKLGASLRACGHHVSWLAFPKSDSKGTRDFIRKARAMDLPGEVVEL